jgi:hypothetical protein
MSSRIPEGILQAWNSWLTNTMTARQTRPNMRQRRSAK